MALALAEMVGAVSQGVSAVHRAVLPSRPWPVGMIEVRFQSSPPLGKHYLLTRLVVDPEFRNGRIARALIREAINQIPEEEALLLTMTLGGARNSYRRYGGKKAGEVLAAMLSEVRGKLR